MGGRRHDLALLDALEASAAEVFDGIVWRVCLRGRDPRQGSSAGGRWSPPGEFEVLYTSLSADRALAEIGYRLSLEPVWPSRMVHDLHRVGARVERALRLADVGALQPLGVDIARYGSFDYACTQAVAAAAYFLEFDGLLVPSARAAVLNLVVFLDRSSTLRVEASDQVDWTSWRSTHRG